MLNICELKCPLADETGVFLELDLTQCVQKCNAMKTIQIISLRGTPLDHVHLEETKCRGNQIIFLIKSV